MVNSSLVVAAREAAASMNDGYDKLRVTNLLRESPNGLEEDSEGRVHYLYQHRTKPKDWSDTRRVLGQVEALRLKQRVKRLTRKGAVVWAPPKPDQVPCCC